MGIRLIAIEGPLGGKMVELSFGAYTIGRDASCAVQINDRKASREHAILRVRDGVAEVEDMGSTNGTFVNGARVLQQTIREGDTLRIGDCVFQVRALQEPPVIEEHPDYDRTRVEIPVEIPPPRYAGFWVRLGASIIDHILLSLPFTLLGYIGYFCIGAVRNNPLCWGIIYGVIVAVGWAAYYVWLDGSCGQTIGRKAVGIWVATGDQRQISTSDALTRYLVHFIAARLAPFVVSTAVVGVALLVLGAGTSISDWIRLSKENRDVLRAIWGTTLLAYLFFYYILLAADEQKRGWHDKSAGTVVLHK